LNVQNIPEVFRQMAMDQIKMGVQAGMEQQQIDDPAQAEMRAKLVQRQMDELATAINEIDQLTVGAEIDSAGHRALLDLGVTALPDSKTAKQMAAGPKEASKFLGFLLPDSVVRMHLNSSMPEDDAQNLAGMFDSFKKQVNDSIDNSDDLDDDKEKAKVKKLANEALDIVAASLKKGIFNGGLSLTGTGPFTLAGGVYLDGAPKMEGVFKQTVEMFKDEDDAPEVKLDADEYQGVKFHKLSFDLDDEEEDDKNAKDAKKNADADDDDDDGNEALAEFFGDPLELTLGFGPQSFYFALGNEGVSTLKRVMDRSADGKSAPSAPEVEATLALAPLLKFAAEQKEENAMLGLVADGLKQGGKDHVLLTAVPVANGARYRLEAEEGVLKLLSALGKLAAAQQQRVPAGN
jgi:hypothetical protein